MSHSIDIYPDLDLAWISYFGTGTDHDYREVVRKYPAHPDFRLGQKMLVDLRDLERLKFRHLIVILLQARISEYAMKSPNEIIQVIVAPSTLAQRAANTVLKSWRGLKTPVVRTVVGDLDEATDILGIEAHVLHRIGQEIRESRHRDPAGRDHRWA